MVRSLYFTIPTKCRREQYLVSARLFFHAFIASGQQGRFSRLVKMLLQLVNPVLPPQQGQQLFLKTLSHDLK